VQAELLAGALRGASSAIAIFGVKWKAFGMRVRDLKVRPVPGGIPNNPRICRSTHNSGGR